MITLMALVLLGERILEWAPAIGLVVALATGTALVLADGPTGRALPDGKQNDRLLGQHG